jgi:hypothetical protein
VIAITGQCVDVDPAAGNRPETPPAGLIPQICAVVDGTGEHALPRRFHQPHPIGRPEPIHRAAHERLDPGNIGMAQAVQFRKLNDPHRARLHGSILAAQIREFIGEVLAREGPQRGRLPDTLRTFENQAAIRLHPGRKIRATAEISHREPAARVYSVPSEPR